MGLSGLWCVMCYCWLLVVLLCGHCAAVWSVHPSVAPQQRARARPCVHGECLNMVLV